MSQAEVTRIIAVRHGQTAWNAETRIQGQLDIGLNENGVWQARRVAAALRDEGLHAVYSSDLSRARQTAALIAGSSGLPVCLDPGLRERAFGAFEGLRWAEIESRWPEDHARWRSRDADFAPGGGESLRSFFERAVGSCIRLAARHPGQNIALVAHGGVMDCLYRAAARLELSAPRTWLLGNAMVNRLLYTTQGLSLVGWGDAAHLEAHRDDESGQYAAGADAAW